MNHAIDLASADTSRPPPPAPLGTPDWLRAANAEGLLRETLLDLAESKREIATLKHAMQTVENVLAADPKADDFTLSLVRVLQVARGDR